MYNIVNNHCKFTLENKPADDCVGYLYSIRSQPHVSDGAGFHSRFVVERKNKIKMKFIGLYTPII